MRMIVQMNISKTYYNRNEVQFPHLIALIILDLLEKADLTAKAKEKESNTD